ncbi:hypothetical protein MMC11_002259 [Xylographa trunciseda]|nr:hypothetical protein [Xylographa trunciseda]
MLNLIAYIKPERVSQSAPNTANMQAAAAAEKDTITDVLKNIYRRVMSAPQPTQERVPRELHRVGNASQPTSLASAADPKQFIQKKTTITKIDAIWGFLTVGQGLETAASDMSTLMKLPETLERASQNQSVTLMSSSKFHTWLKTNSSTELLVDDIVSKEEIHECTQSHLSFVCAKVLEAVDFQSRYPNGRRTGKVFSVRWFWGEHLDTSIDNNAHPTRMIKSLIVQLLMQIEDVNRHDTLQFDIDLDVDELTAFSNDGLIGLCKVFGKLVRSLPSLCVFFCVLDGNSHYEGKERDPNMDILMNELFAIADSIQPCVFKLLITTSAESSLVGI